MGGSLSAPLSMFMEVYSDHGHHLELISRHRISKVKIIQSAQFQGAQVRWGQPSEEVTLER